MIDIQRHTPSRTLHGSELRDRNWPWTMLSLMCYVSTSYSYHQHKFGKMIVTSSRSEQKYACKGRSESPCLGMDMLLYIARPGSYRICLL